MLIYFSNRLQRKLLYSLFHDLGNELNVNIWFSTKDTWGMYFMWVLVCQKQVSRAGWNYYIPQYLCLMVNSSDAIFEPSNEDILHKDTFSFHCLSFLNTEMLQVVGTFPSGRQGSIYYTPHTTKLLGGYIGFTPSVRLSVHLSVHPSPSLIPCPLCSVKICIFGNFFKICNFDFVLFWLGMWCESRMGNAGAGAISERRRSSCFSFT